MIVTRSVWMALLIGAILIVAILVTRSRGGPRRDAVPLVEIRGDPIEAASQPGSNSTSRPPAAGRKKYPKPASFQKRMVEYYVDPANGTNQEPLAAFPTSPAKVVFSRAQLDAIDDSSIPSGYEKVGFSRLSAFPFDVTPDMADGTQDPATASRTTRSKIPDEIQALDNRQVAIRGFLIPLRMDEGLAVEFLLMRDQNLCCFGTVPRINEWILVRVAARGVKPVMDQPITAMGRLHVGDLRENGYLTGIYRLDADRIHGPEGN